MSHGNGMKTSRKVLQFKEMITQAPVLAYFDQNKPIVLKCDSSKSGVGAPIKQAEKVVANASRALTQ